jgi:two-component system nitrate/nitrite response regulator NarL
LLSASEYKPIRCAINVNELVQVPLTDSKRALFVISGELQQNGASAPLEEVRLLRERFPDARLVIVSSACRVDDIFAALGAGANGYILNTMTSDILTKSFDLIMSGATVLPYEFTRELRDWKNTKSPLGNWPAMSADGRDICDSHLSANNRTRELSGRETAIMSRLIRGDSNKIIAHSTSLAEPTVKTHVKAILRKIGAKNRTQAALWAVTNLGAALDTAPSHQLQIDSRIKAGCEAASSAQGARFAR